MNLLPHWLGEKLKAFFPSQIAVDRGQSQRERAEEESVEGAAPSSSISREATGASSGQYDVFLSFRGLDTRKGFTDHLYQSLLKAGFCVFKDDKSIQMGEEFSSQILNAIARSKISILIISEKYASSKWCLRELIHMMDRKKSASHIVLPIFYKVTPADVRHLKGNFGKAFNLSRKYFDEKDIQKGPSALSEVSSLNGWESTIFAGGHEGELIEDVVKTVISKLHKDFQLNVPKQLVGLDGPMKEIMNWIDSPSINARMVGIYGMGGIGKTTLAKCIYNQLSKKFEHVSFLSDVRETVKRHGLMHLQGLLISEILKDKMEVSTIDYGINIIKSRFNGKKVLILLDDVDDKAQLDALAGECDWFMEGSLIIVTTRNKTILDQSEFKDIYEYRLNELDEAQALLLFNKHAFRMDQSPEDFESVSRGIISTMDGLPLALKVVGSHLYKKTNKEVWEDVRKKLKSQPHRDVQEILRISYDALEDGHKQIFLDIACFFIGKNREFAMCMWEGCGIYPTDGIEELKLRCLIKIEDDGEFKMHDQLRDLGRSMLCQGQLPEECSGPWDDDYEGTERVIRFPETRQAIDQGRVASSSSGKKGENLQRRRFDYRMRTASSGDSNEHLSEARWFHDWVRAASSGDSNELLSEVRWLQWRKRGSDWFLWTTNWHLPKLSVLELSFSGTTKDWEAGSSIRASEQLRVLDLASCEKLTSLPDLSAFTQLESLNITDCWKLKHLQPSIGKLKSLVSLDLSGCDHLKELPGEVRDLDDLEELVVDSTDITEIPTSICSLPKLKRLTARGCKSLRGISTSIGDLQNLQHLDVSDSEIEELPSSIGRLKNLRTLKITHTQISDLPELPSGLTSLSISCQSPRLPQLSTLIHLEELHIQACHLLEDIPELASTLLKFCVEKCHKLTLLKPDGCKSLEELSIENCNSVKRFDLSQLNHLKRLRAESCDSLVEVQGLNKLEFLEDIYIDRCNSIKSLLFSESQCLKRLERYLLQQSSRNLRSSWCEVLQRTDTLEL